MLKEPIQTEQLKILMSHKAAITYGGASVGLLTVITLWGGDANHVGLLRWLFVCLVLCAIRWAICNSYNKKGDQQQLADRKLWGNLFTWSSVANGLVWGSVPIFFFPDEPYYLALLLGLHACYISAAASSTSIFLPTFYGFIFPSSILFFVGFIFNGGWSYWPHALLVLIYAAATAILGLKNNRSLTEQILLRFENTSLMAELVDQRDRAESAMLGKNRFLAAASHDLRQPVHALGLFVDSLEKYQENDESKRILGKIRQSTAALGSLFHGLLDISKLDANVVENEPCNFRIDELLSMLQTEYQQTALVKGLSLSIPSDTGLVVYLDPGLFERIMRNIVSNALNYTDFGTVTVSVEQESVDQIRIMVKDTGRGIPEQEQTNIFSEYHQLENPERDRQKGMGLGLAIVRRLCDLMNIPITVKSAPDAGSTFTIRVPKGEVDKLVSQAPPSTAPNKSLGYRIVVVDDEVDILDGMQEILTSWGCSVVTAESTADATKVLQNFGEPELIIADFRLRGNDSGLNTIEMIREEFNADIPAILITGDTAPERLQQAASASVQVLHKPVEPARLRQVIAQIEPMAVVV